MGFDDIAPTAKHLILLELLDILESTGRLQPGAAEAPTRPDVYPCSDRRHSGADSGLARRVTRLVAFGK